MRRILLAAASLSASCASVNAQTALAPTPSIDLGWLAGEWVECGRGGAVTEEHWLGSATALVGVNWSRTAAGRTSWEHLRIGLREGQVTYFASPEGAQAPTAFTIASASQHMAVFENAANDFPKRITYRREGDALWASATDLAGKGPSWTFRRKVAGSACPTGPSSH